MAAQRTFSVLCSADAFVSLTCGKEYTYLCVRDDFIKALLRLFFLVARFTSLFSCFPFLFCMEKVRVDGREAREGGRAYVYVDLPISI